MLRRRDDAIAEIDVADPKQAHLVLAEPEASHQEQGCTVALMVLGAHDGIDCLRLVRLSPPIGLATSGTDAPELPRAKSATGAARRTAREEKLLDGDRATARRPLVPSGRA